MANTLELWSSYIEWLRENVPLSHANLAAPATEDQIAEVERMVGHTLPDAVKVVWRSNDGQKVTMIETRLAPPAVPCIPTLSLLSTAMVLEVWCEWETLRRTKAGSALDDLQQMGASAEPDKVRALYTNSGWIPLWADPVRADYLGVDLDPDTRGVRGQIINFGRDEEEHFVFAADVDALLNILLEEVRSGAWQPSKVPYGSDGETDWFGGAKSHFFNALHRRWKERQPISPLDAARARPTESYEEHQKPNLIRGEMTKNAAQSHDDFIEAAIAFLNENAGVHRSARYHVDVDREPGELETTGVSGTGLVSEDARAIEMDSDFVGGMLLDGAIDRLVDATNETDPIATVDFIFQKVGDHWTQNGFIQTVSERQLLDEARAALDERMRVALLAMALPSWTLIRLNRRGKKPLRITCMVKKEAEKLQATEAIEELLREYESFFRSRAFELQVLEAEIDVKRPQKIKVKASYGVSRDE